MRPIPFLVAGMPRTGTTLMMRGLQAHPLVRMFGELMHASEEERCRNHAIVNHDGTTTSYLVGADPMEFLRQHVFVQRAAPPIRAVGFKLHGIHLEISGDRSLPELLRDEIPDLRIVHVVRPNYLDVLISWETARRTGQWFLAGGDRAECPPFAIDPKSAISFFEKQRDCDRMFDQVFQLSPYVQVGYDELVADFGGAMGRVFRFLGIGPFEVHPAILKQATKSPKEAISNYDCLAQLISRTKYAHLVREN